MLLLAGGAAPVHGESDAVDGDEASGGVRLGLSAAVHDIDGFFIGQKQIGLIPSVQINDRVTVSAPVFYTVGDNQHVWMVDAGGHIACNPGGGPFWAGMTFMQQVFLLGSQAPEEDHYLMHEFSFGYSHAVTENISAAPLLTFRDPFGRYQEGIDRLQEHFPSYSKLEFGVQITFQSDVW